MTTYRRMAEDVVNWIDRREKRTLKHPTRRLTLHGSGGWAEARQVVRARGRALGLADDIIAHLGGAYGADALAILELVEEDGSLAKRLLSDLPYIRAEMLYVCREEMALTLEDALQRRTHIALEDRLRGTEVAAPVAHLIGPELGWDAAEEARQVEHYLASARLHAGPFAGRLPLLVSGSELAI